MNRMRIFEKDVLKQYKYTCVRCNGSHYIYKNPTGHTVSVPLHLNRMIARRLEKEIRMEARLIG